MKLLLRKVPGTSVSISDASWQQSKYKRNEFDKKCSCNLGHHPDMYVTGGQIVPLHHPDMYVTGRQIVPLHHPDMDVNRQ